MADYFSPTVVQPSIAASEITPLEHLLLSQIFTAEPDGDAVYFYASEGINDLPVFPVEDVRAALTASDGIESHAAAMVRDEIANLGADDAYLQLDISVSGWEALFQDILRRSTTLKYITVVVSWTCTKMRPDGFGGMAILITPTEIMVRSTDSMIEEMIGIAEYGPTGVERGSG